MSRTGAGSRSHIPALDGVRALAAAGVLVSHVAIGSGFATAERWKSAPVVLSPLRELFARGDVGVTVFFMLSGFLMFRPLAAALLEGTEPGGWRRYVVRRVARIVPLYWFITTVAIVINATGALGGQRTPVPPARDLIRYYTLTHVYFFDTFLRAPVGPSWSLATEVTFYLLLPFFTMALWRWARTGGVVRASTQIRACSGLIAVSIVFKVVVVLTTPDPTDLAGDTRSLVRSWLPTNLDLFAVGMIMAVVWVALRTGRATTARPTPTPTSATQWLTHGALAAAVAAYWLSSHAIGLPVTQFGYTGAQELARHLGYATTAAFLLAPACFAPDVGVVRGLRSRPMVWLGLISYGVYLWHQLISDLWFRATGHPPFGAPFVQELLVVAIGSVAVASVTYVMVERPALEGLTARLASRSRSPRDQ